MPPAHLLVSAVLIAGILLAIGVSVWVLKRRRAKGAPGTCGKCGYNVTGIPTFTCPECGSDLRDVGIVQGSGPAGRPSRESMALGAQLAGWTLLYAALYGFLGAHSYPTSLEKLEQRKIEYGLIDEYLWPYAGQSTHSVVLKPESTAYDAVFVSEQRKARFRGWRNAPVVNWTGNGGAAGLEEFRMTLELQLSRDNTTPGAVPVTPALLVVDLPSMNWSYDDISTPGQKFTGQGPIDQDVIYAWFYRNGLTVSSERVKDEALALADMIKMSATSGKVAWPGTTGRMEAVAQTQRASGAYGLAGYPFTPGRGTAQDAYGPAWSIYWLSIPFGLGVYTYGANWIWARHRKQKRKRRREAAANREPNALLGNTQTSRTLTILFTDLKDYTSRTAANSRDGLLDMLKANQQIVERVVKRNRGKVMKTIGDAYLATFESATDAVLAGLQIQQGAVEYNRTQPAGKQLEYRVAVCTGEVLFTGGDVFGTPVNLAARVQAVAEVGQVYFTESTYHAINSPDVRHEEVGERELKGIPGPVRLFKAVPAGVLDREGSGSSTTV